MGIQNENPSFNTAISNWYANKHDIKKDQDIKLPKKLQETCPEVPDNLKKLALQKFDQMTLFGIGVGSTSNTELFMAKREINLLAGLLKNVESIIDFNFDGEVSDKEIHILKQALETSNDLTEVTERLLKLKYSCLKKLANTTIYQKIKDSREKQTLIGVDSFSEKEIKEFHSALNTIFYNIFGINEDTLEDSVNNLKMMYAIEDAFESIYDVEFLATVNLLIINLFEPVDKMKKGLDELKTEHLPENVNSGTQKPSIKKISALKFKPLPEYKEPKPQKTSVVVGYINENIKDLGGKAFLDKINAKLKKQGKPILVSAKTILAQTIKESGNTYSAKSGFKLDAISNKGAIGLRQMMPSSFMILAKKNQVPSHLLDSKQKACLAKLGKAPLLKKQTKKSIQKLKPKSYPIIVQLKNYSEVIIEDEGDLLFLKSNKIPLNSKTIEMYCNSKKTTPGSIYNELVEPKFNMLAGICFLTEEKEGDMGLYFGGRSIVRNQYTNAISQVLSQMPGTKNVTYTVMPKNTLSHIVRKIGHTNTKSIMAANKLKSTNIKPGTVLKIPIVHNKNLHIVQSGETLGKIALKKGISLDRLLSANGLNKKSRIAPGKKLRIPREHSYIASASKKTTKVKSLAAQKAKNRTKTITFKKGMTFYSLSRIYNTSVKAIKLANPGLIATEIQSGQKLKIPVNSG